MATSEVADDDVLWRPTAERIERSALRAYLDWLEEREGRPFPDHDALWAWSVEDLDRFWVSIVDYFEVELSQPWTQVRTSDPMPHTRWFPGARLSWAQHALRRGSDDDTALVCVREGGEPAREITFGQLRRSVARWPRGCARRVCVPGTPWRPTCPTPSTRWSACSPRRPWARCGPAAPPTSAARARSPGWPSCEPVVLIAADGYHWNGKDVDRGDVVDQLRHGLPTLRHVVHVAYAFPDRPAPEGATTWDEAAGAATRRSSSTRSSSRTRCGCSSPPARPDARRASCTATAGSRSRAPSGPGSTAGCGPGSGCSPTPPPGGRCGTCSSARWARARASFSTRAVPAIRSARCGRSGPAPAPTPCSWARRSSRRRRRPGCHPATTCTST